jgi:cytochrome c-type biogenesis protein CcmH
MEQQISKFIAQGKTKDEILEFYVGLYGERILAVPVATGFNIMAWAAPIGAGIFAFGFLILYIKTPKKIEENIHLESDDIPFDDEIEKELKALDK